MNELQTFDNGLFKLIAKAENGESLFDAETVAKSLGIVDIKNNVEYVRWSRVNSYLPDYSPQVAKGDFIPEPMVYLLAFKANNDVSKNFQHWLAVKVLPKLRETSYPSDPRSQLKLMFDFSEETAQRVDKIEDDLQEIKENSVLAIGDYNVISDRVNKRVSEVSRAYGISSRKARSELFRDINGGIKKITGVSRRTQLRSKHYELVMDYINDWEPMTATKMIIREIELKFKEESA